MEPNNIHYELFIQAWIDGDRATVDRLWEQIEPFDFATSLGFALDRGDVELDQIRGMIEEFNLNPTTLISSFHSNVIGRVDHLIQHPLPRYPPREREIHNYLLDRGAQPRTGLFLTYVLQDPIDYPLLLKSLSNYPLYPGELTIRDIRIVLRILVLRGYDNLACEIFKGHYGGNREFLTEDEAIDHILQRCEDRSTLAFKAARATHLHPGEKVAGSDYPRELEKLMRETRPHQEP